MVHIAHTSQLYFKLLKEQWSFYSAVSASRLPWLLLSMVLWEIVFILSDDCLKRKSQSRSLHMVLYHKRISLEQWRVYGSICIQDMVEV